MRKLILSILLVILWAAPALAAGTLTWSDNSLNEDGFNIYRAPNKTGTFTLVGSVAAGIATYVDAAGASGNCYKVTSFIQIDATTQSESVFSNTDCLPPSAPGSVRSR